MTQNSWSVGFKARFDPQTGNLALSQPKIPMAVFCWVAVDPQPESPLRNREILCPRAVSQILVSCSYRVPSRKDCILSILFLSFMFLLSFLCESPLIFIVSHHFSDSASIWSPKNSGFLTTNSQDGQGGHMELTASVAMVCCRWVMGLYIFGKIHGFFIVEYGYRSKLGTPMYPNN